MLVVPAYCLNDKQAVHFFPRIGKLPSGQLSFSIRESGDYAYHLDSRLRGNDVKLTLFAFCKSLFGQLANCRTR
jgi:hypothetical protein